jgi:predicted RNA methylase
MDSDTIEAIASEFNDWEDDDEESYDIKGLFSNITFSKVEELLAYEKQEYGLDLHQVKNEIGEAFTSEFVIMMINFIRSRVENHCEVVDRTFVDQVVRCIIEKSFSSDLSYMIPVLQNDALLFLLCDFFNIDDDNSEEDIKGNSSSLNESSELALRYRNLVDMITSMDLDTKSSADDAYYFDSYGHISIHEQMLRDSARTNSYANALLLNSDFIKDKIVLDVGCGTGILSMLAAKAGARKVIGVDCSSIINVARKIIEKNGLAEKVFLVQGRLEEVTLPVSQDEEIDIIISEWMGYGLYFENMLSSVLFARDAHLAENGIVMPSAAILFIEAMTAAGEEDRINWWNDVYSFDMTDMIELFSAEAQVERANPDLVISNRGNIHTLDIATASDEHLDFDVPFELVKIF